MDTQLLLLLAAIVASWYSLKERIKVVEVKLDPMYKEWLENGSSNTKSAAAGKG